MYFKFLLLFCIREIAIFGLSVFKKVRNYVGHTTFYTLVKV
jgi:hypothetical protein